MPGHIALGAPDALREYMIENLNLYSRSPANQFAAKLSTGGGNYDDLQNWSYFAMDDWRGGVGKKDPESGGFLYGELETRYPNRLTVPNALSLTVSENPSLPLNYGWQVGRDAYPDSTLTIGTTQAVQKIAHAINGIVTDNVYVTLWLDGDYTGVTSITVSLYTSTTSGGRQVPNTLIHSEAFYPDGKPGAKAYGIFFGETLSAATYYHVVIEPTAAGQVITLPVITTGVAAMDEFSTYNGSVWTGGYTAAAFLHGIFMVNVTPPARPNIIYFPVNGYLYTVDGSLTLWRKSSIAAGWSLIDVIDEECTDLIVVGNELWIAQGAANNFYKMDNTETLAAAGVVADFFLRANGLLWRTVGGNVYYTADGTTWTGPIAVTWGGFEVRGMAAMGDYIYCSTDDGLYYIGFGDEIVYVTSWPSISATNGVGMVNHQGTLFIPLQESILRYDGQSMIPVGLDMGEGLPQDRIGTVTGFQSLNNWLIAYLSPVDDTSRSTVWAYNDQGWHYLAGFPYGMHPTDASYDINTRHLYFADQLNHVWQLPVEVSANFNTISAIPVPKMPSGWLETDWFFGNLYEVFKDIESLYVSGDDIDSTHCVQLYWMDDASTNWELLGTVESTRAELRWSDYTTRPNTRQLKIGVLLTTNNDVPPVVRVIRLKYHPMVSDWFRWSFPILCSDNQELLDHEISLYTRAEQEEHLTELIKRVPPFILQDLDGIQYEVKITGCQIQIIDYEYLLDGPSYNAIYSITMEQIRPAVYDG